LGERDREVVDNEKRGRVAGYGEKRGEKRGFGFKCHMKLPIPFITRVMHMENTI
jgi:hypothetical protein